MYANVLPGGHGALRPAAPAPWHMTPQAHGQRPQTSNAWATVQRTTSSILAPISGTFGGQAFAGQQSQQTFYCPICLENHSVSERVYFSACGSVKHGICKETMAEYIKGAVSVGRAVKCHQCSELATDQEVRDFTDEATFQKYIKFKRMREDPELRECPSCSKLCKPEVLNGEIKAEMSCACGEEFCYFHDLAHRGKSCEDYQAEQTKQDRLAEKGALRGTKKCPNADCGISTEKVSGCNHMTCARCQCHWCWICEKAISNGADGVTDHYSMGGECGGRLFEDMNPGSPFYYLLPLLVFPVKVVCFLLCLLAVICATALYPIVFVMLLPTNRFKCEQKAFKTTWVVSLCIGAIPLMTVTLLWYLIAGTLYLGMYYCGAGLEHLIYLFRAPLDAVVPVGYCFRTCWKRCCGWSSQDESQDTADDDSGEGSLLSEQDGRDSGSSSNEA